MPLRSPMMGSLLENSQDWTADKLIDMSDSLAHSSMPGIDQLKKT